EDGRPDPERRAEPLELAVTVLAVPGAGTRMLGEEELYDRPPRRVEARVARHNLHAGLDHTRAGRAVDAGLSARRIRNLDRADAAHPDGREPTLEIVAEHGDRNPHDPRGLPDRRPLGDRRRAAVDGQLDCPGVLSAHNAAS